jgi:hypothetical protein
VNGRPPPGAENTALTSLSLLTRSPTRQTDLRCSREHLQKSVSLVHCLSFRRAVSRALARNTELGQSFTAANIQRISRVSLCAASLMSSWAAWLCLPLWSFLGSAILTMWLLRYASGLSGRFGSELEPRAWNGSVIYTRIQEVELDELFNMND